MQQTLPWIIALVAVAGLAPALVWFALRPRKADGPRPLPTEWALSGRPVFSVDERRVYRQLREALPHHIVLSKLPLVRFCQPNDPHQVRFWFDLLGGIHVTFAVCSPNGRVLAAIDLATDSNNASRTAQIKQAVLGACRVRYLRCPVDHLPSIPELQLLVPQSPAAARGPQPAPAVHQARATLATAVASRRRERTTLWQDSGFFHDSFFAPDQRRDAGNSEPGALTSHLDTEGPPTQPPELTDLPLASPSRMTKHLRH
jgi:Protein of unknown function (DUF2726)